MKFIINGYILYILIDLNLIGQIDLFGNDLYFRHIYTSFVSPNSLFSPKPTHVIVLGDLFSSQWIKDMEFKKRVERYKWIFGDSKGVCINCQLSLLSLILLFVTFHFIDSFIYFFI
jgi:hypothetical protein